MIPELGHFALIAALALALVQGIAPLTGVLRRDARLMALARPAALVQFGCVALSYACLTQAFVTNDFSVAYVAQHSNTLLPMLYKVTGVWGGA